MKDTPSPISATPPAAPGPDGLHSGIPIERRPRIGAYVAIASVSLAVGAAGAVLTGHYLRTQPSSAAAEPSAVPARPTPAHAGHNTAGPQVEGGEHSAAPPGSGVYISPVRQQLIGVSTAAVEMRSLDTTIRTVGTLTYDETRVTEVHPKVSGWVERVFVDFVGKPVRRGQPLLTLYSPDLVATQNEYLLALKARRQLADSAFAETRSGAESLVAATRDRLRLWDITDAQIAELERTGQARRTLTLYSPFDGIVLERNTFAGQYISPETSTAKIVDLSTIWAIGQIFEYEARTVKLGDRAEVEFPYGQSIRRLVGRVTFVYPDINPDTRRARVRIELANPRLELKPGTYVTVLLRRTARAELAIPKEALLDSGTTRYAILAHPNGYFEPRVIEVGAAVDQFYPVVTGLAPGDRVVTSAQFLVDSETNLQAAMQSMAGHGHATGGGATTPAAPPSPAAAPSPAPVDHSKHQQ